MKCCLTCKNNCCPFDCLLTAIDGYPAGSMSALLNVLIIEMAGRGRSGGGEDREPALLRPDSGAPQHGSITARHLIRGHNMLSSASSHQPATTFLHLSPHLLQFNFNAIAFCSTTFIEMLYLLRLLVK